MKKLNILEGKRLDIGSFLSFFQPEIISTSAESNISNNAGISDGLSCKSASKVSFKGKSFFFNSLSKDFSIPDIPLLSSSICPTI